jgi:hypothetical protein
MCGVSMDASFHGCSNDTIGDLVRHRRPELPPFSHGGGPIGPHLRHHIRLYTLTFTFGGKGGDYKVPSSYGGGHGLENILWIGHRGEGPSHAGQLRTVCILS